jgi:protein-arginine kinase activator protein McsA
MILLRWRTFNSFIDVKERLIKKNIEKITKEVNDKMNFIEDEKFEDAAQLRDYMIKK